MQTSSSVEPPRDPEIEAISHILTGIFAGDARVWRHADLATRTVDFDAILAEGTFSTQEGHLLRAAASIWKGRGYAVDLGSLTHNMDDEFLAALLNAMRAARGGTLPMDGLVK